MTAAAPSFPLYRVLRDPAFIAGRGLSRAVARCVAHAAPSASDTWIDVGCGSKPYECLFAVDRYVGLDVEVSGHPVENKRADQYFDGLRLPFDDASVDGVVCTEVLEHAEDAAGLVAEIARVLRPGGSAIVSSPFIWPEHETPYDFRRFTLAGLESLFTAAGLDVELSLRTAGAHASIAQVNSLYVHAVIGRDIRVWGSVVTAVLCAPIQLVGLAVDAVFPDRGEFYIENVLALRKPLSSGELTQSR